MGIRQVIVEEKGKGIVRVINTHDWLDNFLARMKASRRQERGHSKAVVLPDYQSSGITPIRVIPRIGHRILERWESETRTWKEVYPKPKHQWQRHLHQRMFLDKRFIYPSPKLINWERNEELIEIEEMVKEELLYELIFGSEDSDL